MDSGCPHCLAIKRSAAGLRLLGERLRFGYRANDAVQADAEVVHRPDNAVLRIEAGFLRGGVTTTFLRSFAGMVRSPPLSYGTR
jgi:hypothetical protein